jgi:hypothetical protein
MVYSLLSFQHVANCTKMNHLSPIKSHTMMQTMPSPKRCKTDKIYVVDGLRPPGDTPIDFLSNPSEELVPLFDPKIHLQIEPPKVIRNLAFEDVAYPYEQPNQEVGFAYTPQPFRILSEEGLRELRSIIDQHKPLHLKQNKRNNTVRGLGYLSTFIRDFTYSKEVIDILSDLAQEPIQPHDAVMNHAHTNVGAVGNGKAVDQWHIDSVDYVCIIIVSDTTNMKGGELQILQLADATGKTFDNLKLHGIPKELVESVNVPLAGHCLFVKGSKLLHSVSPVLEGVEARHSVVQPFTVRNVFAPDLTRLDPFRYQFGDPAYIADLEYARHKAWRVRGQMKFVIEQLPFGTPTNVVADVLESAARELLHGSKLLRGEICDLPGFLVNENDKITKQTSLREVSVSPPAV